MKRNILIICLVMVLVGLTAGSAFVASAADERATELKLMDMERRIFIDKLATQRESFEDKARRLETKVIQLERDLEHSTSGFDTRIADLRSHLNERVDDSASYTNKIFAIYTGMFVVFLTALSFLGWRTVKGWIEGKVQELSTGKLEEIVTEELVTKVIENKGSPLIKKIIDKLEKEWPAQIKSMREELLTKAEQGLISQFDDEDNEKLKNVVQDLQETETEEEYDYDDWMLKGLMEYGERKYSEASDSFRNAITLTTNKDKKLDAIEYTANCLQLAKNSSEAEKYYKQYLESESVNNSRAGYDDVLGNCAGLLLARGAREEGFRKLEEAYRVVKQHALMLELLFYEYAHIEGLEDRNVKLHNIKKLIIENDRSVNFTMQINVERAIADGHHNHELLSDLERVICAKKDAEELEKYEEWKQA